MGFGYVLVMLRFGIDLEVFGQSIATKFVRMDTVFNKVVIICSAILDFKSYVIIYKCWAILRGNIHQRCIKAEMCSESHYTSLIKGINTAWGRLIDISWWDGGNTNLTAVNLNVF